MVTIENAYENALISLRTRNCLRRAGYETMDEVMSLLPEDLMRIRNFGEKCLGEIDALREVDMSSIDKGEVVIPANTVAIRMGGTITWQGREWVLLRNGRHGDDRYWLAVTKTAVGTRSTLSLARQAAEAWADHLPADQVVPFEDGCLGKMPDPETVRQAWKKGIMPTYKNYVWTDDKKVIAHLVYTYDNCLWLHGEYGENGYVVMTRIKESVVNDIGSKC